MKIKSILIWIIVGVRIAPAQINEIERLNFLQVSTLHADFVIKGFPKIDKHVPQLEHMESDMRYYTPDTFYVTMENPTTIIGPTMTGKIQFKLVGYLHGGNFPISKEMVFFICKIRNDLFAIDFKKVSKDVFYLEEEVIDTNKIQEKGKIGALSINRDWSKNWMEQKAEAASLEELKAFGNFIRKNYTLRSYCYISPIDVGVYFEPKSEVKEYKGELAILNGITKMMVERSASRKKWLEDNATKVELGSSLCNSPRYQ